MGDLIEPSLLRPLKWRLTCGNSPSVSRHFHLGRNGGVHEFEQYTENCSDSTQVVRESRPGPAEWKPRTG
jgi:hypothetical protein